MTHPALKRIRSLLQRTLLKDRPGFRREHQRWTKAFSQSPPSPQDLERLEHLAQRVEASYQICNRRAQDRPPLQFPPELPITAHCNELIRAIRDRSVVIVAGETGSGKSTQLPKLCLAAGRGLAGRIGCTQPRRIAATAIATRIAEELDRPLGQAAGYKIRFQAQLAPEAYIKVMTDGMLLAETQHDPMLWEYDTLIIDEAHERSLNIDFILGFMQKLLPARKDLRLIITSATLDTAKFSAVFGHAPVFEVSGRRYPVEVRYLPPDPADQERSEAPHIALVLKAVAMLYQSDAAKGDILVFMPTEQDIRDTCEALVGRNYPRTQVLPLFARLTAAKQRRVFARSTARKIIVATNVAETSLTIPDIVYVVDTGLARIAQYSPRTRTTALPVVPISRSSADQRMGRCGRMANGVCIRLYHEEDYLQRPQFTPPEILRANLAEVILRMMALKLGPVEDFPFVDPPAANSLRDGFRLLTELGALSKRSARTARRLGEAFTLTRAGRLMARLPLDPRLARILIEARRENALAEVAVIVAALSIQDPRERPADKATEADQVQAPFEHPASDFLTYLNLWNHFHDTCAQGMPPGKLCRQLYLSFVRMREWQDIHAQILVQLKEAGFKFQAWAKTPVAPSPRETKDARYGAIHRTILSGFLSNIASRKEHNIFQAARGREVMLFPGSALFNRAQNWVVAAELVQTSRLFARTVANIKPEWLEALGRELCQRTYRDPHWDRKRGEVVAYEQVSLHGLIIVPRRKIAYGRINPREASAIFARSALVEGQIDQSFGFMPHNQRLIAEVRGMEDRLRRRDLLVSQEALARIYRQRLSTCFSVCMLNELIQRRGDDAFLRLTRQDILNYTPEERQLMLYPREVSLNARKFEARYRFRPGQPDDGISLMIPSAQASAIPTPALDWLVPGMLAEKLTLLIKGLPKNYRRQLVPVAEYVAIIAREMPREPIALVEALSRFIERRFKVTIPLDAWPLDALPEHLKMRLVVSGPNGEELCSGRDPTLLRQSFDHVLDDDLWQAARRQWEKTDLRCWDFGVLPETIPLAGPHGTEGEVYPSLVQEEHGICLRLFRDRYAARQAHRQGVAGLLALALRKDLKHLKRHLTLPASIQSHCHYLGGARKLERQLYQSIVHRLLQRDLRTPESFQTHLTKVRGKLLPDGQRLRALLMPILAAYADTRACLHQLENDHGRHSPLLELIDRLRHDLARLLPENFMTLYEPERWEHLPRYLSALAVRARRAAVDVEKDRLKDQGVQPHRDRLQQLITALTADSSPLKRQAIEDYFWMLEEFKVSIFAQELKTAQRVSPQRLEQKYRVITRLA